MTWWWQRRLILFGILLGIGLYITETTVSALAPHGETWLEQLLGGDPLTFLARLGVLALPAAFGVYAHTLLKRTQTAADRIAGHMQASLNLAAAAFESTDQGIFITDRKHHIVSVNPAFLEISGYAQKEVRGKTPLQLKSERHNAAFYENIFRSLEDKGHWQGEVWNRRKDGESYPAWQTISPVYNTDTGNVTHYVFMFSDITPIKRHQANKDSLAYHDPLTGLPNRLMLGERLEHALRVRARMKMPVALLFLDLDGFKLINDTQGHTVGDRLLQAVALRLQSMLREGDTVARFGGDEFVILAESCESRSGIVRVAEKVIEQVTQPLQLDNCKIVVQTSIGIAVGPADGADSATLIHAADQAMYRAKATEGSHYCFYEETREQAVQTFPPEHQHNVL